MKVSIDIALTWDLDPANFSDNIDGYLTQITPALEAVGNNIGALSTSVVVGDPETESDPTPTR